MTRWRHGGESLLAVMAESCGGESLLSLMSEEEEDGAENDVEDEELVQQEEFSAYCYEVAKSQLLMGIYRYNLDKGVLPSDIVLKYWRSYEEDDSEKDEEEEWKKRHPSERETLGRK